MGECEPRAAYKEPHLGQCSMQGRINMKSQTYRHADICDALPINPRLVLCLFVCVCEREREREFGLWVWYTEHY